MMTQEPLSKTTIADITEDCGIGHMTRSQLLLAIQNEAGEHFCSKKTV